MIDLGQSSVVKSCQHQMSKIEHHSVSYQIYKAKLKNEQSPSQKKRQFFNYYIIFLLSSKLPDLRL